jgi:hypothetical protein
MIKEGHDNINSKNMAFNNIFYCKYNDCLGWGIRLWYLTPLSTIYQLFRGGQFYW